MHPQDIIARRLYELLDAMSDERPFVAYDTAASYEADTIYSDRINFIHKLAYSVMTALEEHEYRIVKKHQIFPTVAPQTSIRGREEDT